MNKKLLTSFIICMTLVISSGTSMSRSITLPYEMKFDSGYDWGDLKWVVNNATGNHVTSGCWSGGCAKFTPPTVALPAGNGRYSGLGSFEFINTKQINVRVLVKIGPTYETTARDSGYGYQNKFIIVTRNDSGERGMTILERQPYSTPHYWSFGACQDNDCKYQCGGLTCSRPNGYDLFKSIEHSGEWFCLELESDLSAAISRVYIWTQDGSLNGLYSTYTLTDLAGYYNSIQIIGGFFNGIHTLDPNAYVMFDELIISNNYIGPPIDFVLKIPRPPNDLHIVQ